MKKIAWIFVSILILGVSSCNESASKKVDQEKASENANKAATANAAMTFDKTSHDFGTIQEGETVQTTFTFTNTGQSDLIIVDDGAGGTNRKAAFSRVLTLTDGNATALAIALG